MRLGILLSGYEQLPLFTFLSTLDHEYELFVDWKFQPRSEKSETLVNERVRTGLDYLLSTVGVEKCIVPPMQELLLLQDPNYKDIILPLYTEYLHAQVLPSSLIGKLGLLTTLSNEKNAQSLIEKAISEYTLTIKQSAIRKFHTPFAFWGKTVRMRSHFLTSYSKSDRMVRKTIKTDIRYFRDANVDTIIPTCWSHIYYEKILTHQLNCKKIKFHGTIAIDATIKKLLSEEEQGSGYSVTLHCTDDSVSWLGEKKWERLLSRGGTILISRKIV